MVNVNEFKVLCETIVNKDETGFYSVPQFNSALPVIVQQYIDKCIKTIRDYQLGMNKNFALVAKCERALFDIIVKTDVNISSVGSANLPSDWYDTKGINYNYIAQNPLTKIPYRVRECTADEFASFQNSQLNTPTKKHAVATYYDGVLKFAPKDLGKAEFIYYKAAPNPVWGWTLVNNEEVYDPTTSVNIPLSPQSNNDLAFLLCQYLGLSIKDEFIEQFGQQEEVKQ